ncbi:hypothetical protein ABY42_06935 [Haloferax gibbonsii]|uniref:Uncharacterized protein n=1 Tax=Haloferax gibbonsii TaxID=35746 RepID=A0A0K1ISP5_HALGI|nr:hypothetical protein ABY42_06935 [Haloferax gibbonsii]
MIDSLGSVRLVGWLVEFDAGGSLRCGWFVTIRLVGWSFEFDAGGSLLFVVVRLVLPGYSVDSDSCPRSQTFMTLSPVGGVWLTSRIVFGRSLVLLMCFLGSCYHGSWIKISAMLYYDLLAY